MPIEPCPSCGQIDAVQKVSVIAEGGASRHDMHTKGGGAFVPEFSARSTGTSMTDLAESLKWPEKPMSWSRIATIPFWATVLWILALALDGFSVFFAVFGAVLVLAWAWFLYLRLVMRRGVVRFERAHDRWRKLWFCGRCDIAFIPGTSLKVDREAVQEFIYDDDPDLPV